MSTPPPTMHEQGSGVRKDCSNTSVPSLLWITATSLPPTPRRGRSTTPEGRRGRSTTPEGRRGRSRTPDLRMDSDLLAQVNTLTKQRNLLLWLLVHALLLLAVAGAYYY
jgi:hypothetical protein